MVDLVCLIVGVHRRYVLISDLKSLGEAIGGGDFKLSIFLVVGGGGGSGDGGVGGDGGDVPKNKVHITPNFQVAPYQDAY